jgi:ParB family chromosome partitioning protein
MEKEISKSSITSNKVEKKGLGRGLAALLGGDEELPYVSTSSQAASPAIEDVSVKAAITSIQEKIVQEPIKETASVEQVDKEYRIRRIPTEQIHANAEQPRQFFSDAQLEELAESICEQGLIQPIIVRMIGDQNYQIVAGERRWRACKLLGMTEIPAIIREQDENVEKADLASVIENIQRVDLNAVELADAYAKILKAYNFTQEELAKKLGVSRASVANTIRLQKLPNIVKDLIIQGKLTEGHARPLLTLEKEEDIISLANEASTLNLSVRDVELKVREKIQGPLPHGASVKPNIIAQATSPMQSESVQKTPEHLAAEEELRGIFGTKVVIRGNVKGGMIELFYSNDDSLHRLLHQLRSVTK